MKIYSLVIISIILFGCSANTKQRNKDETNLLNEWKVDSFGCLKYRTKERAFYIKDSLDLMNKSSSFIINKLGAPNTIRKEANTEILKYYFNTVCRENIFVDSLDYCWIEMVIESNRLKRIDIICH